MADEATSNESDPKTPDPKTPEPESVIPESTAPASEPTATGIAGATPAPQAPVVDAAPAKAKAAAAAPAKRAPVAAEAPKPVDKPIDPFADPLSLDDEAPKAKIIRAKGSKNITHGIAHVQASFNNTLVSITDLRGNTIGWSTAGKMGFKGSRKSTAYAAQLVAQDACRQAMGHGLREVEVRVKGPGSGRESAVRAIQAVGLDITVIKDVTPVPHNGCRPPKQRRV